MEKIIALVTGIFNHDPELSRNAQNVRTVVSAELNDVDEVTDYLVGIISSRVCENLGIA